MVVRRAAAAALVVLVTFLVAAETPDDLERRALAAMGEGRYAEARGLLERAVAARPDQPRLLYNLACCASRLGDTLGAARRLEAAWRAGFADLDLARADPDLDALRATDDGQRLLERLEREAAEARHRRGAPFLYDATVLTSGRVVAPERVEPGRRLPLVVALHGYGATPEGMAGILAAAGVSPDLVLCAPSGPYPVLLDQGLGRSWYPPTALVDELVRTAGVGGQADRRRELDRREQESAERAVLAAVDAVSREQPVDRDAVFLLGHSQGGVLAYGLALAHPDRFRGLVVVGSRLREEDATAERLARAAGRLKVLVCHSPEDPAVDIEEGRSASRRLGDAGVETRLVRYAGGHGFTADLVRRIVGWIGETAAGGNAEATSVPAAEGAPPAQPPAP